MPRKPKPRGKESADRLTVVNAFVPLDEELKAAWLRGEYSKVSIKAEEQAKARWGGRIQSIRYVFQRGRVQKRAFVTGTPGKATLNRRRSTFDPYSRYAMPSGAKKNVTGFQVRLAIKSPRMRDERGRFMPSVKAGSLRSRDRKGRFKAFPAQIGKNSTRKKSRSATSKPTPSRKKVNAPTSPRPSRPAGRKVAAAKRSGGAQATGKRIKKK